MQIREMHELSMLIGIGAKNWKFQQLFIKELKIVVPKQSIFIKNFMKWTDL
jgi:hypothetical protein